MRKTTRRAAIAGGIAAGLAAASAAVLWPRLRKPPLGMEIPPATLARGAALVRAEPVIDVHAHPGRSFLSGAEPDSLLVRLMPDGFEAERIRGMREAGVTGSLLALVGDFAVLGFADRGLTVTREFAPGEPWRDFRRQLARVAGLVEDGTLPLARTPADLVAAHDAGAAAILLACEGADFCEGWLGRIGEAHAAGLRAITLVHYRSNELGDAQTSAPVRVGLTPFGRDVVQEMNRLGMVIDVAHASLETVRDVVAASRTPVLLSHSALDTGPVRSPRFVSVEHARAVSEAGGVIGAWPAGIGSETLADFVEQVLALVDAVGAAHVAIGSDLDANYRPVLTEYADFPLLAAALLHRGLDEADTARILGGNFLRLFETVTSLRSR